jgi:hypothetical protein
MEGIKNFLDKKKFTKKKKKIVEFQDIALELIKDFNINNKKEVSILFGFLKRQIARGMWWKVKEVREYMESKNIKSLRYFMSCFRNKEKNERNINKKND